MVYIALAVSVLLAAVDQVLKIIVQNGLSDKSTYPLITVSGKDWLNLTYVENTGAGFSILEGCTVFLTVFTGLVMIGAIVLLLSKKIKEPVTIWGISLIIGGGFGNLIDRLFRDGAVIDYIDLRIINFAVFNFADCCIVVGAILVMISLIFISSDKKEDTKELVEENDEK